MSVTTRKPKHVSFEEAESAGVTVPHCPADIWEFTTIEKRRLAEMEITICNLRADRDSEQRWANEYHQQAEALEAENHRLRAEHQLWVAEKCDLTRENQRLQAELHAERANAQARAFAEMDEILRREG